MPSLIVYDKEGLPQTVRYHELPALLLNELQKTVKRVVTLEEDIQQFKSENKTQAATISTLQTEKAMLINNTNALIATMAAFIN